MELTGHKRGNVKHVSFIFEKTLIQSDVCLKREAVSYCVSLPALVPYTISSGSGEVGCKLVAKFRAKFFYPLLTPENGMIFLGGVLPAN